MTEQEKQGMIEKLQIQVNGAVGYLIVLEQVAKENNSLELYPVFQDVTVRSMLEDYKRLQALRGY